MRLQIISTDVSLVGAQGPAYRKTVARNDAALGASWLVCDEYGLAESGVDAARLALGAAVLMGSVIGHEATFKLSQTVSGRKAEWTLCACA
jgi:hypothetical protein